MGMRCGRFCRSRSLNAPRMATRGEEHSTPRRTRSRKQPTSEGSRPDSMILIRRIVLGKPCP
jgi:hypothetical protein